MPLAVDFETIPEMLRGLRARYAGSGKAVLGYRDKKTRAWVDVSWGELFDQVDAFAGFLHARGVGPGDRVAVLAENRPEWAVADLAAQALGAVNVPLYTTLPASQVAYIVRDSGAKGLVVSTGLQLRKADRLAAECPALGFVVSMAELRKDRPPDRTVAWDDAVAEGRAHALVHADALAALGAAVTPDDLSALIYTSGTTGLPKGVALTHRNLCSNAKAAHARLPLGEADVHLSFLPLSHAFERTGGHTAMLAAGAQIVYAESVEAVSKNLAEVRPTVLIAVPRLFERVHATIRKQVEGGSAVKRGVFAWAVATGKAAEARRRAGRPVGPLLAARRALAHRLVFATLHAKLGGRLRYAVSGGAALPKEVGEFFAAAGVRLVEGYGLTETSPVVSANPLERPVYGTVGHVFPGVEVGIRDLASGALLARQHGDAYPSALASPDGEVVVRGPNVMRGYWNDDAATAAAVDAEGWFRTGDVGRFEEGYLRITDRIKHMLVSKGGKNVYPGPIEERLGSDPLVDALMLVGEGRDFLTALVAPDAEALRARVPGLPEDPAALAASPAARAPYDALLDAYNREAPPHEKVRDFRLLPEGFTVENDLLTPTLKLKRRTIEERHAALVEAMYAGRDGGE